MPAEIADSDEESEVLVEQVNSVPSPRSSFPANLSQLDGAPAAVSPSKIDFADFIDPTQRLSDLPSSQNPLLCRGTGSTEKILLGLEQARTDFASSSPSLKSDPGRDNMSPEMTSRSQRRGHSHNGTGRLSTEDLFTKNKRPKTYDTKKRTSDTQSTDLFGDVRLTNELNGASATEASEGGQAVSPPASLPEADTPRERNRPRRVISLLQQVPDAQLSTSTSSMGGYQSYNLDFRGSGSGLDVDANPFGNVSQVSIDEGLVAQQVYTEGGMEDVDLSNVFRAEQPVMPTADVGQEMMTSPERPESAAVMTPGVVDPSMLMLDSMQDPPLESGRASKRRKTDIVTSRAMSSPAPAPPHRASSVSAESASNVSDSRQPKKRGRKPKGSKLTASSPAPEVEAVEHHAMDPPAAPTRTRRATLESSSQASQTSESNTKRKRKKTKTDEDQQQTSPIKVPSSEVNLSDEVVIGLPKEQYKPRPSRSRSKRSDDGEVPAVEAVADKDRDGNFEDQPIEQPTTKPVAKGKGKKTKVKRAKTSAFALQKSQAMLSDGDEDVLYMDERPASVKLDLPPDIHALKTEDTKTGVEQGDDDDEIVRPAARSTKTAHVTIEIPRPQPDENNKPDKAEPKKRGRKPSKRTPTAPTPEPLTEDEAGSPSTALPSEAHRPALGDKDPNIPLSPSPTKPTETISAIANQDNKENHTPVPSPSPSKPHSISPSTHSPLKSTASVTLKSQYRVGLSKRHSIPSLLRRVDKSKKAPTKVSTTVKERKVKAGTGCEDGEGEEGDEDGRLRLGLRDKSGALIEWEF